MSRRLPTQGLNAKAQRGRAAAKKGEGTTTRNSKNKTSNIQHRTLQPLTISSHSISHAGFTPCPPGESAPHYYSPIAGEITRIYPVVFWLGLDSIIGSIELR